MRAPVGFNTFHTVLPERLLAIKNSPKMTTTSIGARPLPAGFSSTRAPSPRRGRRRVWHFLGKTPLDSARKEERVMFIIVVCGEDVGNVDTMWLFRAVLKDKSSIPYFYAT